MNITIDKFSITSDSHNLIVTETDKLREKEDGVISNSGIGSRFFGNIPDALNYILEQKLKSSEATTLKGFYADYVEFKEWIKDQFEIAGR